jgi:hypothetical protein
VSQKKKNAHCMGSFPPHSHIFSQRLAVISQRAIPRDVQSSHNVRIIPKRGNARFWQMVGEKMLRPEDPGGLFGPGGFAVASQPVDKDDAGSASQRSR